MKRFLLIFFVALLVSQTGGMEKGAVLGKACNYVLRTKSESFSSPGYPQFYPNNVLCSWTIEGPVGSYILLSIDDFSVEASKECKFDAVEIYDGVSSEIAFQANKLCGEHAPQKIRTKGNVLTIVLKSDESQTEKGFKMRYEIMEGCQGTFVSKHGDFSSPSYPNEYPSNLYCKYDIVRGDGRSVHVQFVDFDLEDLLYDDCLDYVAIYIGSDRQGGRLLGKYCGTSVPPTEMCFQEEKVMIDFVSDEGVGKRGIKVKFSVSDKACPGDFAGQPGKQALPLGTKYSSRQIRLHTKALHLEKAVDMAASVKKKSVTERLAVEEEFRTAAVTRPAKPATGDYDKTSDEVAHSALPTAETITTGWEDVDELPARSGSPSSLANTSQVKANLQQSEMTTPADLPVNATARRWAPRTTFSDLSREKELGIVSSSLNQTNGTLIIAHPSDLKDLSTNHVLASTTSTGGGDHINMTDKSSETQSPLTGNPARTLVLKSLDELTTTAYDPRQLELVTLPEFPTRVSHAKGGKAGVDFNLPVYTLKYELPHLNDSTDNQTTVVTAHSEVIAAKTPSTNESEEVSKLIVTEKSKDGPFSSYFLPLSGKGESSLSFLPNAVNTKHASGSSLTTLATHEQQGYGSANQLLSNVKPTPPTRNRSPPDIDISSQSLSHSTEMPNSGIIKLLTGIQHLVSTRNSQNSVSATEATVMAGQALKTSLLPDTDATSSSELGTQSVNINTPGEWLKAATKQESHSFEALSSQPVLETVRRKATESENLPGPANSALPSSERSDHPGTVSPATTRRFTLHTTSSGGLNKPSTTTSITSRKRSTHSFSTNSVRTTLQWYTEKSELGTLTTAAPLLNIHPSSTASEIMFAVSTTVNKSGSNHLTKASYPSGRPNLVTKLLTVDMEIEGKESASTLATATKTSSTNIANIYTDSTSNYNEAANTEKARTISTTFPYSSQNDFTKSPQTTISLPAGFKLEGFSESLFLSGNISDHQTNLVPAISNGEAWHTTTTNAAGSTEPVVKLHSLDSHGSPLLRDSPTPSGYVLPQGRGTLVQNSATDALSPVTMTLTYNQPLYSSPTPTEASLQLDVDSVPKNKNRPLMTDAEYSGKTMASAGFEFIDLLHKTHEDSTFENVTATTGLPKESSLNSNFDNSKILSTVGTSISSTANHATGQSKTFHEPYLNNSLPVSMSGRQVPKFQPVSSAAQDMMTHTGTHDAKTVQFSPEPSDGWRFTETNPLAPALNFTYPKSDLEGFLQEKFKGTLKQSETNTITIGVVERSKMMTAISDIVDSPMSFPSKVDASLVTIDDLPQSERTNSRQVNSKSRHLKFSNPASVQITPPTIEEEPHSDQNAVKTRMTLPAGAKDLAQQFSGYSTIANSTGIQPGYIPASGSSPSTRVITREVTLMGEFTDRAKSVLTDKSKSYVPAISPDQATKEHAPSIQPPTGTSTTWANMGKHGAASSNPRSATPRVAWTHTVFTKNDGAFNIAVGKKDEHRNVDDQIETFFFTTIIPRKSKELEGSLYGAIAKTESPTTASRLATPSEWGGSQSTNHESQNGMLKATIPIRSSRKEEPSPTNVITSNQYVASTLLEDGYTNAMAPTSGGNNDSLSQANSGGNFDSTSQPALGRYVFTSNPTTTGTEESGSKRSFSPYKDKIKQFTEYPEERNVGSSVPQSEPDPNVTMKTDLSSLPRSNVDFNRHTSAGSISDGISEMMAENRDVTMNKNLMFFNRSAEVAASIEIVTSPSTSLREESRHSVHKLTTGTFPSQSERQIRKATTAAAYNANEIWDKLYRRQVSTLRPNTGLNVLKRNHTAEDVMQTAIRTLAHTQKPVEEPQPTNVSSILIKSITEENLHTKHISTESTRNAILSNEPEAGKWHTFKKTTKKVTRLLSRGEATTQHFSLIPAKNYSTPQESHKPLNQTGYDLLNMESGGEIRSHPTQFPGDKPENFLAKTGIVQILPRSTKRPSTWKRENYIKSKDACDKYWTLEFGNETIYYAALNETKRNILEEALNSTITASWDVAWPFKSMLGKLGMMHRGTVLQTASTYWLCYKRKQILLELSSSELEGNGVLKLLEETTPAPQTLRVFLERLRSPVKMYLKICT